MDATTPSATGTDPFSYIQERGFYFPQEFTTRFLLALKTKPFAILTGISGTGKTKIAQLCAEYYTRRDAVEVEVETRPKDDSQDVFIPIDEATLTSGLVTPRAGQIDYFNPADTDPGRTVTIRVTNVLGATGDQSARVNNRSQVSGVGTSYLTLTLPAALRQALVETGARIGDYLRFSIVEEFRRFEVSLFRPESRVIEEPPECRRAFVSVQPDWAAPTALVGSWNQTTAEYDRTAFLEVMLRADRDWREATERGRAPRPHFVILDEMNIARIEYYLADFLSGIESRRPAADGSGVVQEAIRLHNNPREPHWLDELGYRHRLQRELPIPPNLLVIGTVNVDDTTYGLSPKVLDRANVIEADRLDFGAFMGTAAAEERSPLVLPADAARTLSIGDGQLGSRELTVSLAERLAPMVEINEVLSTGHRQFGYRVMNEIALYLHNAMTLIADTPAVVDAALDAQVLQKILPKLAFGPQPAQRLLENLRDVCMAGPGESARFPRSALRLSEMIDVGEPAWAGYLRPAGVAS